MFKNRRLFRKTPAGMLLRAGGIFAASAATALGASVSVGLGGNAYVVSGGNGARITDAGAERWTNPDAVVSVFFSLERPQKDVMLSLEASGNAEYEVDCAGRTLRAKAEGEGAADASVPVGRVDFPNAGYQRVDIRGVAAGGNGDFGKISALTLDGVEGRVAYVHDFSPFFGRRGPSVHLRYERPRAAADLEYFYNEVRVPEGADALHTFYMACGFAQGYFGFQTNSPTERRVLFSVWSPYETDDPAKVPEDCRVTTSKKGAAVVVRSFGSEGSGGQSFLRYPWRAGTPYKFLVRVRPNDDGTTQYTGWFFATEENRWRLIASFRRPKTRTWLEFPHSFLENFSPDSGWNERSVLFSNQWARDVRGTWHELLDGRFSCDETGNRSVRLDYAGTLSDDRKGFILKNCGFFNGTTPSGTTFTREPTGTPPPQIDFAALEENNC